MAVTKKDLWRMLRNTESGLMAHVIDDILEQHGDSDEEVQGYLQNVYEHGGVSGTITSLIYHNDCEEFVKTHLSEILDIYNELLDCGIAPKELTVDYLAWLGYETMVNIILSEEPLNDFNM